jgi:hypothetical protein
MKSFEIQKSFWMQRNLAISKHPLGFALLYPAYGPYQVTRHSIPTIVLMARYRRRVSLVAGIGGAGKSAPQAFSGACESWDGTVEIV